MEIPQHTPHDIPPHRHRRSRRLPSFGCITSLGCLLTLSIIFNFIIMGTVVIKPEEISQQRKFKERHIRGKGENKIAVITIQGTITDQPTSLSDMAAANVVISQLKQAKKDTKVKGILIHINSPGGSVTASDIIYQEMTNVRKEKPIVVLMGGTCASGCVYLAAPANVLVAHPTTVTGSIGVIMSTLNFSKFMENHGIQGVTIASKENKALLSPFDPVKEEHKKILKDIVDEMHQRFVSIVSKWRKIPEKTLMTFADGRVFSAQHAKKQKLIDEIGYEEKAKKEILRLTKLSSARFVRYQRNISFIEFIQGFASLPKQWKPRSTFNIETLLYLKTPRAYYLWNPSQRH